MQGLTRLTSKSGESLFSFLLSASWTGSGSSAHLSPLYCSFWGGGLDRWMRDAASERRFNVAGVRFTRENFGLKNGLRIGLKFHTLGNNRSLHISQHQNGISSHFSSQICFFSIRPQLARRDNQLCGMTRRQDLRSGRRR